MEGRDLRMRATELAESAIRVRGRLRLAGLGLFRGRGGLVDVMPEVLRFVGDTELAIFRAGGKGELQREQAK